MHWLYSSHRRVVAMLCTAAFLITTQASTMFNEVSFLQIKFLEGRWKGVAPDGKEFFEEYVWVAPNLLESRRHADASYSKVTDGSTVSLKNGVITSTWGQFTWKASSLSGTKACFEPIEAPSSFCWERVASDTLTVTQKWAGADGKAQSLVVKLSRFVQ